MLPFDVKRFKCIEEEEHVPSSLTDDTELHNPECNALTVGSLTD
jgi:hypothetical protein